MHSTDGASAVAEWFGGANRVLFVHAHPDDETISTGGTLAALAESGREPILVTLTRGEQGEVVPGPFALLAGTPGLARHRETELAAALGMLGVAAHAYLGTPPARAEGLEPRTYEDSGMQWGDDGLALAADDAPATALTRAPAVEALNDLLILAATLGAEAVVSYDIRGGYGHPDHVFAHRAGRAVARGLEVPYWEIVADPSEERVDAVELHDISPWLERKVAALRAHGTQLSVDGEEIVHVGGQRQPIDRIEAFRRLD